MSFSPNLKVLSDWRSSLAVAFSVLRRIAFVVTSDFSFGTFDPQTNFLTMASTNYLVNRARYLRIGNILFLSLDIESTLAAVFTLNVQVTIPATAAGSSTEYQAFAGFGSNAGVRETMVAEIQGGTSTMDIYRYAVGAYTAGTWRIKLNSFVEVI